MTGADWLSSVFPETDQRRFCRRRKPLLRLSMADFSSSKTLLRLYMAPKAENAWYKRWNSATHTRHTAEKVPYISHLAVFHLRERDFESSIPGNTGAEYIPINNST